MEALQLNSTTPATAPARKPRVLVMIPAGKRYDHDNVRIYDQPRDQYLDNYFNTGDMVVYDSTLKLFDFHDMDVLKIREYTEADIERYNAQFDYVFLRGSNFIHEYMQWERAVEVLDRLKIPVHVVGVGAQAEAKRKIELSEESKRVWKMISERCHSIGVRGVFTAEVLNDNGIHNVEIVGCPSLFRKRNRDLKLRLKAPDEVKKLAFSLRRETHKVYAVDPAGYVDRQREIMLRLADAFDITVTIHGEPEEKAFHAGDEERIKKATERLRALKWFTPETEDKIAAIYRERLFLHDAVSDYDDMANEQDFALGYRVHGVLPAMANGVPGLLIDYDTRSSELAETLSIPTVKEDTLPSIKDVHSLLDPSQFTAFEANFKSNYDRMKAFLDKNNIPNRM